MALVPYRSRDFQVAPAQWVAATSNKPAARGIYPGTGRRTKGRTMSTRVNTRRLMEACAERAWLHTQFALSSSLSAGSVQVINDMSQGTANAQRLNNQTRFVELEYCGFFETLVTSSADAGRLVIFRDSNPEGQLPTVAQLLCQSNPTSCFNPDLVGNQETPRFKVLANHFITWSNPGPFSTGSTNYYSPPLTGRLRLDFTSTYEGNAGTYADIQTNGLYFLVLTQNASTSLLLDTCVKYLRM